MSIEELGFGLATVGALAVPPARAVTIQDGAGSSFDGDVSAGDGDEGTGPFFVAKGGGAFENDLYARYQKVYVETREGRLTFVPDLRPVRSSVFPDGTATFDKTMVEHEVLDLLAEAAPLEPENVQEAARFSSVAGAVIAGAGAASTVDEKKASPARPTKERMVREGNVRRKSETGRKKKRMRFNESIELERSAFGNITWTGYM